MSGTRRAGDQQICRHRVQLVLRVRKPSPSRKSLAIRRSNGSRETRALALGCNSPHRERVAKCRGRKGFQGAVAAQSRRISPLCTVTCAPSSRAAGHEEGCDPRPGAATPSRARAGDPKNINFNTVKDLKHQIDGQRKTGPQQRSRVASACCGRAGLGLSVSAFA